MWGVGSEGVFAQGTKQARTAPAYTLNMLVLNIMFDE